MCVVSMVMEHYGDKWKPLVPPSPGVWSFPPVPGQPPPITSEEIAEFRTLLERARKYDREHNEPDCELETKRQVLRDLAAVLGIDISFIEKEKV